MLLWILIALIVLIVWALWLTLTVTKLLVIPLWVAIVASVVVVAAGFLSVYVRRWRERRAASALENAIAQQGAQQALNANPTRRAEIQELQRQVTQGIASLKTSKLGKGKSGAAALYSLPWYMIIGPPGAGKTTAIKHSGLQFPFAADGVRGVGGTRNCDWWFTNEAILLDTAGRYTTETDDRDEWMSFLGMLLKYRSKHPINGILVAIGVNDLIDANEQQIESMGKKIRARIDEVMTQLKMVVPVYMLFTKVDLIAGFVEVFGDLRKSDRAQIWGATLKLDRDKSKPAEIFEQEFDLLVQRLHGRAVKRQVTERNREARERIYQFPLEFSAIKRNLSDLMGHIFVVNAFQGTPIFRGFYFTSGTQEGKPLDRVLQRMGQAMGVRPPELAAHAAHQPGTESKSYFLYDLFMNVVFPDGNLAVRSKGEVARQRIMRVAISGAALLLGLVLAGPSIIAYFNNRAFLKDTLATAEGTKDIDWGSPEPGNKKVERLNPLLDKLKELDTFEKDGPPLKMQWFMYQADAVRNPSMTVYVAQIQKGFAVPCKEKLEQRLKTVAGQHYLKERSLLKTYLMLSDVDHLDPEWATGRFVPLWAEILRPTVSINEYELRKVLVPHVRYYFELVKAGKVKPISISQELVDRVRKTLQGVPVQKRYYDQFVSYLIEEKYDEAGDDGRDNKKYPPLTLPEIFQDRPDIQKILSSKRHKKEKKWQEVEGPYTEKGHAAVILGVDQGKAMLEREEWVVPLSPDEKADKIPVYISRLTEDYEQRYVEQWTDFLADIEVQKPASVKEAIDLYETLSRPDWAYLRLLRQLQDNTQWSKGSSVLDNKEVARITNQKLNDKVTSASGLSFKLDVRKINNKVSMVPGTFKRTIEFGIPLETAGGGAASLSETPLSKWVTKLGEVRKDLKDAENATPNADVRLVADKLLAAAAEIDAMLQPFDDTSRKLLYPLLTDPLVIGPTKLPPPGANKVAIPGAPKPGAPPPFIPLPRK